MWIEEGGRQLAESQWRQEEQVYTVNGGKSCEFSEIER